MRLPRVRISLRMFLLLAMTAAIPVWLYVQSVRREVASLAVGNPPMILLEIHVLDDATGQPIPGAKVDMPFLHPSWRGRPEMISGDLRKEHASPDWRPLPLATDEGGLARTALKGSLRRVIERHAYGLFPVTGPKVEFHPVHGLRVEADGYEPWTEFLNDITPDDGKPLVNLRRMPITVRLKPVARPASR